MRALAFPASSCLVLACSLLASACAQTTPGSGFVVADGGVRDLGGLGGGGGDLSGAKAIDLATPPDLLTPPDLAPAPDLATPPDLAPAGAIPGQACSADADCASGLCKPVAAGAKYCVVPCTSQADCQGYFNLFCEAQTPGNASGYCIPRSPMHCATCVADSDCGSLSERCLQAPGDIALACHIDCALAGASACPIDYSCVSVADGNVTRKLCLPNAGVCLDSLGGFCDRIAIPESCSRTNTAGVCRGERNCIVASERFDKCDAAAPQFKTDCAQQDPAGCTEAYAPAAISTKANCGACGVSCGAGQDCCGATCKSLDTVANCGGCGIACSNGQGCCNSACTTLDTVANCGACGNACPGQTNTSDALCTNRACDMTCRGDNYDVNKNPADGCEVVDVVPPGHSEQTAASRGSKPCNDGASTDSFTGTIESDGRVHANPPVTAFDPTVGAAPDYWSVFATGGTFCVDDYSVTLTTTGGGGTPCYTATIITNNQAQSVTVSGNGSATMSAGSGAYSDGTTIYFEIAKTCSLPVQESVTYTVSYHL